MTKLKVLNLYAGIGGNRKLWPDDEIEVTAVEINPEIAKIYRDFFPKDKVIVGDAHQYLLEHYKEFDFIWSSPPCPSHSRMRQQVGINASKNVKPIYPCMELYQEIIFIKYHFKGKWVVENVISYYNPLIPPKEINRHYFWANFSLIKKKHLETQDITHIKKEDNIFGFEIGKYKLSNNYNHVKVLRNCVNPNLGLHIFNCAFKEKQVTLK